jgi:hypothetical protein
MKRKWMSQWLLLAIIFFVSMPSEGFTQDSWLTSLKSSTYPERQRHDQKANDMEVALVHLKHSSFALDKESVPNIKGAEGHILLQLTCALDERMKSALEGCGVRLLQYIPTNTWKAKIPASSIQK